MVRHLVCNLGFTTIGAALVLQGCSKPSPDSLDRPPHAVVSRAALTEPLASGPATHDGRKTYESSSPSAPPLAQYQTEDPPPWLAQLLRDPDPNVRIQALDAWARQPGESLDPVTYALVDPDESVRARAQELLEQELVRR